MSPELRRFVLFVMAGGAAAAVNIASRIAINWYVRYEFAIVLAYLCGMAAAYVLNRLFVFASSGRPASAEFTRFALVNLAAAAQVWCVSVGLSRLMLPAIGFTWHAETVAHVIGVVSPIYTSYLGHKYFSFAKAQE